MSRLKSSQLDLLILMLRASPYCRNIDFRFPVMQCQTSVQASTSGAELNAAVARYHDARAAMILGILQRLPKDEVERIEAAFYVEEEFCHAHEPPELAS